MSLANAMEETEPIGYIFEALLAMEYVRTLVSYSWLGLTYR